MSAIARSETAGSGTAAATTTDTWSELHHVLVLEEVADALESALVKLQDVDEISPEERRTRRQTGRIGRLLDELTTQLARLGA